MITKDTQFCFGLDRSPDPWMQTGEYYWRFYSKTCHGPWCRTRPGAFLAWLKAWRQHP